MSIDEFKNIWKDSTKDRILEQYYFDYINWKSVIKEWQDLRDKAIEYINHAQNYGTMAHLKPYVNGDDLLNILQNGSDK